MLLSKHLNHSERLQLTYFILGNKCPPTLYVDWILKRELHVSDEATRDHTQCHFRA